jgi:hypothetical protein
MRLRSLSWFRCCLLNSRNVAARSSLVTSPRSPLGARAPTRPDDLGQVSIHSQFLARPAIDPCGWRICEQT